MGKNRNVGARTGNQVSLKTDNISQYLKEVQRDVSGGIATEHTYRPALKVLIESLGKGITATNEPKRVKCGAPDFIITRKETPLGHIKAKDVGKSLDAIEKDARSAIPRTSDGKQLKRYREGLNNLILTNYLEFRWYVGGEHRMSVRLARVGAQGKLRKEKDGEKQALQLINQFLAAKVPTIGTPRELAARMAAMARLIRQIISRALEDDDKGGSLHDQMEGFRQVLLHSLKPDEFADMYAQTICYGLFAARCNHNGGQRFTRQQAAYELPRTNPFLRKMFGYMAGPELDHRVTWAVDDLAELLNRADMSAILKDFGKRTRREDPVLHFYETFLAAYDPKMREARGVYYTPEPVVSYIVRSVDHILKNDFGLPDGLADTSMIDLRSGTGVPPVNNHGQDGHATCGTGVPPVNNHGRDGHATGAQATCDTTKMCHKVLILDPAVGTGTFLHGVIDHIHERIVGRGQAGMWSGYVSEHLLPRLFGLELLMAPYAMAHMKLDLQLKETKYDFKTDERLNIFLTNTLEESFEVSHVLPFANWLAEEANEAGKVKKDFPVMVVLGNPPYSGHSQTPAERYVTIKKGQEYFVESKGSHTRRKATKDIRRKEKTFIGRLIQDYFYVDGEPLGERNPKWLNDDYVKFIRFAQWRIEQTGYGILAFITNHSYLDNPTFRGMRQNLMNTFDDIYVLDLHGNTKKKEKCPDGSKDENVFDIQQGVAIGIFVKRSTGVPPVDDHGQDGHATGGTGVPPVNNHGQDGHATIRHAHLWGLREAWEKSNSGQRDLIGGKYYWLHDNDVSTSEWTTIKPQTPFYLFVPQDTGLHEEYERGWKVTDIMSVNSVGIVTARDKLTVQWDEKLIWDTVTDFCKLPPEEAREKYRLGQDVRDWKVALAQQDLRDAGPNKRNLCKILYRPFDARFTYYTGKSRGFLCMPRPDVMRHMLAGRNIGLIATRQTRDEWHVFSTRHIMGHKSLAAYDINSLFPLYLYPKPEQDNLLDIEEPTDAPGGRRPNLAKEFISDLSGKLKMTFIPDGKGNLGIKGGTGVPPVDNHGQDGYVPRGTGILPVNNHGRDGHAPIKLNNHGQDGHATELHIRQGAYLPHWTQKGAIYFVTFRLADSLPRSVLAEIEAERKRLTTKSRKQKKELSHSERQQMTALFSERVEKYLDQGTGECHLSDKRVAAVLRDALLHFEGERYRLLAWCIMPNHVHVVVRPEPGHDLSDILHSWKSFTAKKANKLLKREGRFWQPEYYDHLIRDEKDLERCIEYTYYNPEKADFKEWRWRGYFENAGHRQHDSGTGVSPVDNHGQDDHATGGGTGVSPVDNHGQDDHATGTFGPENVFSYMYAVFHSPTYRSRYVEFLKIDFPRLPLTSKQPLFRALCGLGEELVGLHLMEKQVPPKTRFDVAGDNHVEKVRYTQPGQAAPVGRVWINKEQYFDNVPQNVWEFHIGGYQVCQKWLKDRKGRKLTYDDLTHYQHIVSALAETIRLMTEIDRTIDKHGGWPIK